MNKIYRSIWNESLGAWVAASEITNSKTKGDDKTGVLNSCSAIELSKNQAIKGFFKYSYFCLALMAIGLPSYAAGLCGDIPVDYLVVCNADSSPATDTNSMPDIIYEGPALLTIDGTVRPITLNGIVAVRSTGTEPVSIDLKGKITQKLMYSTESVAVGQYEHYLVPHSIKINVGPEVKLINNYLSPTGVFYNVAAKVDNHEIEINTKGEITSLASNPIESNSSPMFHAGVLAIDPTGGNQSRISVFNSGSITLSSDGGKGGKTAGIFAVADGLGSSNSVTVENTGKIDVKNIVGTSILTGSGIWSSNTGTGGILIKNTGIIKSSGDWRNVFYGINANSKTGAINIDSGNINLQNLGPVRGVEAGSAKKIKVNVTGNIYALGEKNTSIGVFVDVFPLENNPPETYEINVFSGKSILSNGIGIAAVSMKGGVINLASGSVVASADNNLSRYAIYSSIGQDVINSKANIVGIIDTNDDKDQLYLSAGSLKGSVFMGGGDDLLVLSGAFNSAEVSSLDGHDGDDTFELKATTANLDGSTISNWETIKLSDKANLTLTGGELALPLATNPANLPSGLFIDSTSTLNIPKNFILTGNVSHSGKINLRSSSVGHTFQMNGDYVGNGGSFLLNAQLNGDNSPSDKILINGNTSGYSIVSVKNVGGKGAATVDGIKVIEVIGNSDADFLLSKPVQAGMWEYILNKKGKNWFLESSYNPDGYIEPSPVPDSLPDEEKNTEETATSTDTSNPQFNNNITPAKPVIPPRIYRPGVSAYVLNQNLSTEMLGLSTGTLQQRLGEQYNAQIAACLPDSNPSVFPKEGAWGRYSVSSLDLSGKTQFDLQSDTTLLQFGKDIVRDYNSSDLSRRHIGVLLNLASADADVFNRARALAGLDVYTGHIKSRQIGMGAYLTQYTKNGGYIDWVAQVNQISSDFKDSYGEESVQRANSLSASLEWGKPQKLGRSNWLLEPQAQVQYHFIAHNRLNDAVSNIASFNSQSARFRVGSRLTWNSQAELPSSETDTIKTNTVYLSASLAKEILSNSSVNIGGDKVLEENSQNPWLELGVGGQIPIFNNAFLFGQVQVQKNLGGEKRSALSGNVGLRVNW